MKITQRRNIHVYWTCAEKHFSIWLVNKTAYARKTMEFGSKMMEFRVKLEIQYMYKERFTQLLVFCQCTWCRCELTDKYIDAHPDCICPSCCLITHRIGGWWNFAAMYSHSTCWLWHTWPIDLDLWAAECLMLVLSWVNICHVSLPSGKYSPYNCCWLHERSVFNSSCCTLESLYWLSRIAQL